MKKFLLSIFMVAGIGAASAQVYTANDTVAFSTWTAYDLDGDTYGWTVTDLTGSGLTLESQGGCAISNSWSGAAGVLTPDNVLVSPAIDMSGVSQAASLSWGCGSVESTASGWFEESYAVYVFDATALAGLMTGTFPTPLFDGTLTAGEVMETQSVDISSFAGQSDVYVAIRHYNCTDENFIVFDDVVISDVTGAEEAVANEIVAYPNPAIDVLNISASSTINSISIVGIDGKIISNQSVNSLNTQLNVSELVSGVYFYEIVNENGSTVRKTFVKK